LPARPKPEFFADLYRRFQAPVARFDCGKMCAPLNGGEPVCCSTDHAIPLMDRAEFRLLRRRSDLWRRFVPQDAHARKVVADVHETCVAATCKGARFCERDNRSLACRSFPFFPYLTREDDLVGLAYYWGFEDRCWVISNLGVVDRTFVREFIDTYERLFAADPEERQAFRAESASLRRVFARARRAIPLIGRDGRAYEVLRGGRIVPANLGRFRKHGPYRSEAAYARAVKEAAAAAAG
jgi:hypothetical protein